MVLVNEVVKSGGKKVDDYSIKDDKTVVCGKARFSLLSYRLLKLENSKDGVFEELKSVRALYRPEPIGVKGVYEKDGRIFIDCGHFTVNYNSKNNRFSAESLEITDNDSGRTVWRMGDVDSENLGGVHYSMDVQNRKVIPYGVHPADGTCHDIISKSMLWSYAEMYVSKGVPNPTMKAPPLEDILSSKTTEELSEKFMNLIDERSKYPPGILSGSGYYVYNGSTTPVCDADNDRIKARNGDDRLDLYFFYYKTDFKQTPRDYMMLFGKVLLLPRYALGLWYSRYPTYNREELETLGLPLDMLVIDMEWHMHGWNGFDWDKKHIPDPDGFLRLLKGMGIHTTLNIHPECVPVENSRFEAFLEAAGIVPGENDYYINEKITYDLVKVFKNFNISKKRHSDAFMNVLHNPVLHQGVDFWWIDGHAPVDESYGIDAQFWTNRVYFSYIHDALPDRRPMILSRTPGLGAYRFPFHFTGDTYSQWEVLECQIEYTLRAGNMGMSYITHDISGHNNNITGNYRKKDTIFMDPELYLRWVQYAVLNPINSIMELSICCF